MADNFDNQDVIVKDDEIEKSNPKKRSMSEKEEVHDEANAILPPKKRRYNSDNEDANVQISAAAAIKVKEETGIVQVKPESAVQQPNSIVFGCRYNLGCDWLSPTFERVELVQQPPPRDNDPVATEKPVHFELIADIEVECIPPRKVISKNDPASMDWFVTLYNMLDGASKGLAQAHHAFESEPTLAPKNMAVTTQILKTNTEQMFRSLCLPTFRTMSTKEAYPKNDDECCIGVLEMDAHKEYHNESACFTPKLVLNFVHQGKSALVPKHWALAAAEAVMRTPLDKEWFTLLNISSKYALLANMQPYENTRAPHRTRAGLLGTHWHVEDILPIPQNQTHPSPRWRLITRGFDTIE
jgi:hypothetical protein